MKGWVCGHPSVTGQAWDRESSPVWDRRSTNCATQPTIPVTIYMLHATNTAITLPPLGVWSITISVSVCLFDCFSVGSRVSKITHANFIKLSLHFTSLAVARSYSDGNAMYFRFRGWRCFHILGLMSQNQRRRICFVQFDRWRHRGRSLHLINAEHKQQYISKLKDGERRGYW